jgi:hypothetical protein
MNDGYLDAECVITFLQKIGFVRPNAWKHENPLVTELYYPVQFFQTAHAATISFMIYVFNKRHCIMKSSVRTLAAIQQTNLDHVFQKCAL